MDNSQQENGARGEWIRFGILVLVMIGTIFVVAASRPFVANRVVPAFLGSQGNHQVSLPIMEDSGEVAPAEGGTTEEPVAADDDAGGEETAVEDDTSAANAGAEEAEADTSGTETEAPSTANNITHTIARGESLFVLAQRYNVTVQQIVEANDISNPNRIAVGDVLVIPQP